MTDFYIRLIVLVVVVWFIGFFCGILYREGK